MQGTHGLFRPNELENTQELENGCQPMIDYGAVENHDKDKADCEVYGQHNGAPQQPLLSEFVFIVKGKHRHLFDNT
ncbi:hypothetical protein [Kaarinaea lacus]